MNRLTGRVHKLADNVDTDAIIPACYLNTTDPQELASHCLEGLAADFPDRIKPGDLIIAGRNFGCGSSREHAPLAIKTRGVSCIIAVSFARIFYRNSFNLGLPLLECPQAVAGCRDGDRLEVDLEKGLIVNQTTGASFSAEPIPDFMLELIADGGLMRQLAKRLKAG
ncbi:MAG: 3-isopropylmalate dehydratase small subunit [Thermodesulfobacteriota bacterium]